MTLDSFVQVLKVLAELIYYLCRFPLQIYKNLNQTALPAIERSLDAYSGIKSMAVILPSYNEEDYIKETLNSLVSEPKIDTIDILLSDGGSKDRTVEIAESFPSVRIVSGGKNRSESLNAGRMHTPDADVLLFLHADTILTPGWSEEIRRVLGTIGNEHAVGYFSFAVREDIKGLNLLIKGTNLRSRYFKLPYGDQGLFMRRSTFDALGGFPSVPFMEDYDFARMCYYRKVPLIQSPFPAKTSARRWVVNGIVWNTMLNQLILFGNALGVPRKRLGLWYTAFAYKDFGGSNTKKTITT
jgi:rSAM/selenodomain-associated transferase 2